MFLKYKGLELNVSQNINDLGYMILMIKRTWTTCLWELKGLELYVSHNIKDLSYMFLEI